MDTTKSYSLQVFRAIAAIMVVLYHMTDLSQKEFGYKFLGNAFSFGYVGVDFFFVLSGFIILYVHGKDVGNPTKLRGYLTKRFIRLYPIYWCVASAKILIVLLLPSFAKSYETSAVYIVKSLVLIPQVELPIIGAAWTLSYEILFYLLFGIVILIGSLWGFRLGTIWTSAILGLLLLKTFGSFFEAHFLIQFLLNERNVEFILGCLAAYIVLHRKVKYDRFTAIVGGLLFLYFSWYVNQGLEVFSFTFTFGLASFLLVVGSTSVEISQNISWPKILVFLGDASYSIYLTHVMFFNLFTVVFLRLGLLSFLNPFFLTITMVVFAITGGSIVYLLLERPLILYLRKKLLPPKPVPILAESQK